MGRNHLLLKDFPENCHDQTILKPFYKDFSSRSSPVVFRTLWRLANRCNLSTLFSKYFIREPMIVVIINNRKFNDIEQIVRIR